MRHVLVGCTAIPLNERVLWSRAYLPLAASGVRLLFVENVHSKSLESRNNYVSAVLVISLHPDHLFMQGSRSTPNPILTITLTYL